MTLGTVLLARGRNGDGENMTLHIRRPGLRVLALATALVLAAPFASAQAVKPAAGNLTIAFAAEATTLDPVKYSAGVDTYFIGQIFEQLVKPDPTQKRVNWLAESWDITEVGG